MKRLIVGLVVVLCMLMASLAFAQSVTTGGGATGTVIGGVVAYQSPKGNFDVNLGHAFRIDVDKNAVQVGVIGSYSQSTATPSAVIAAPSSTDASASISTTTNAVAITTFSGAYSQSQSTGSGGQHQSASSSSLTAAATGSQGVKSVDLDLNIGGRR